MKPVLTYILLLSGIFGFAQCSIQGPVVLKNNAIQTYTIIGDTPNCTDCYHWNVAGHNLVAVSAINQKSITIKTVGLGSGDLVASYSNAYGEQKCSISIDITEPGVTTHERPQTQPHIPNIQMQDCQILASNIDIRKEDEVFQILIPKPLDIYKFSYNWNITFSDGTRETASDRIPVVYTPPTRSITEIRLEIKSSNCSKNLVKTFTPGYMNFQGNPNVPPPPEPKQSEFPEAPKGEN